MQNENGIVRKVGIDKATFDSICPKCKEPIKAGELIRFFANASAKHVQCKKKINPFYIVIDDRTIEMGTSYSTARKIAIGFAKKKPQTVFKILDSDNHEIESVTRKGNVIEISSRSSLHTITL